MIIINLVFFKGLHVRQALPQITCCCVNRVVVVSSSWSPAPQLFAGITHEGVREYNSNVAEDTFAFCRASTDASLTQSEKNGGKASSLQSPSGRAFHPLGGRVHIFHQPGRAGVRFNRIKS